MSQSGEYDRVRELLDRLAEIQRESELIRNRIEHIRQSGPSWPDRRRSTRMFDDMPRPSEPTTQPHDE